MVEVPFGTSNLLCITYYLYDLWSRYDEYLADVAYFFPILNFYFPFDGTFSFMQVKVNGTFSFIQVKVDGTLRVPYLINI